MNRYQLTDEEFEMLKPFLPPEHPKKSGRPYRSHRQVLNGIFWILNSGAPWRDLPDCYGPWTTVYDRFRRWRDSGIFPKILNALEAFGRRADVIDFEFSAVDGSVIRAHKSAAGARKNGLNEEKSCAKQGLGRSRGGFSTKIHVLCEGQGLPINVEVTPGQQHESTMLETLLDDVSIAGKPGRPRKRFDVVAGDKGYDGHAVRQAIIKRGSQPLIPHRKKRDGSYPDEAQDFDKEQYKRRNVVERLIGNVKKFRHVATRYDKLAESFRTFVVIGFIKIWLKDLLSYTA